MPKRFASAGELSRLSRRHDAPEGSAFLQIDSTIAPESVFMQANWYREAWRSETGLVSHESDELMLFIGKDHTNSSQLGAEIVFQIENDILTFSSTSLVYIPAGAAHALIEVRNVSAPALCVTYHYSGRVYQESPAAATAPKGTYAGNTASGYHPLDERNIPPEIEAMRVRLLWADGRVVPGSPYIDALWFTVAGQDGPPSHVHDFDEILGFIGGDPDRPEELGANIDFVMDGETIELRKSSFVYAPAGVPHSPIRIPEMTSPRGALLRRRKKELRQRFQITKRDRRDVLPSIPLLCQKACPMLSGRLE